MIAGAYDWTDDMLKIKSMQKKFRDSFNGTEINSARWDVAAISTGARSHPGVFPSHRPAACQPSLFPFSSLASHSPAARRCSIVSALAANAANLAHAGARSAS